MAFIVHAPNSAFDGEIGDVRFKDGTATVEKRSAAFTYFQRHGFRIEKVRPVPAAEAVEPPAADAATDDKPRRGGKAKP